MRGIEERGTDMTTPNPSITADETLDCSGLLCPLPVYKAALALGKLEAGGVLRLVTTDPGAIEDIPAMARQRGDTLLSVEADGEIQVFLLAKGGTA
jgi:tRNA 2-thiouridine synthesizing protein A